MDKPSKTRGIITFIIAIIAVIVMITTSGLLGLILYLFAVVISFLSIDKENRHSVSALINYTKKHCMQYSQRNIAFKWYICNYYSTIPCYTINQLFYDILHRPIKSGRKCFKWCIWRIRQPILKPAHYKKYN